MSSLARSTVPRRPLGPVRRRQILAATVELMREQGLWQVRIADIARRAHISPGSVVYYFGTKDQLFAQAIADVDEAFYAELRARFAQPGAESGLQRLASLISSSSTASWALWIDLWVYARRHPELLDAAHEFHARWCDAIAEVIRYGQGRGEFETVDAEAAALRLAALTDGLAVRLVIDECSLTRALYVSMSAAAAALELGCDHRALDQALAAQALAPTPIETPQP